MIPSVLFLWIIYTSSLVDARGRECCSSITIDPCRETCEQLQSRSSPIPQMQVLVTAAEACPASLTEFWNCINDTLPAIQLMNEWPGKTCCYLARNKRCRRKCHNANTKEAMSRHCRERDEPSFFTCIKKQEVGSQCCGNANGTSCGLLCRAVHLTGVTNHRATREVLADHCHPRDQQVEKCVLKQWQPRAKNGHSFMPCCEKGQTPDCRSKCRALMRMSMSKEDRMEGLSKACSEPQHTDPLWQCFLLLHQQRQNVSTPIASVDNAKLQCCSQASSGRCRKLCAQTYKKGWTYKAEFDTSCSYNPPVSMMEEPMHNCLNDVEQPCQLGCSGLQFCTNFNNRPTEMFRSCNPDADRAAALTFKSWMKGVIHLPQLNIFVKDINKCNPHMWKAVACALEIKPCSSKQNLITFCREDCFRLLSQCADPSKLSWEQVVPVLCNTLPSHGSCVSLSSYLKESPLAMSVGKVTHPCSPNPCGKGEMCLLRKRKCKHKSECHPYVCHAACPLGRSSNVMVPKGTALRLVDTNSNMGGDKDCFMTCQCNHRGKIDDCERLYCLNRHSCKFGTHEMKAHGDTFTMSGRHCVCQSGEMICSLPTCQPTNHFPSYIGNRDTDSCKDVSYSPVCAANGKTYPNQCIASCVGVTRVIANKACRDVDICASKMCPSGFRCVPRPQVCLSDMEAIGKCPQHECVDVVGDCNVHHHDPACDLTGQEYNNMCVLFSHRRTLAYRGHCQAACSTTGVVCGHDGETYSSECAARAARVTIDYHSKCVAFGNVTKKLQADVL